MATFNGAMTIDGDDSGAIPVQAVVSEGSLTLQSEGTSLGRWPVDAISAEPRPAGVGLVLDDDRVVFEVDDADDFLTAVGGPAPAPKRSRRSRKKDPKPGRRKPRRFGLAGYLALVLVVAFVVASAVAPLLIGAVTMLIGVALLLLGATAMLETNVALRLPGGLEGIHLVVLGVTAIIVGMGLTLAG